MSREVEYREILVDDSARFLVADITVYVTLIEWTTEYQDTPHLYIEWEYVSWVVWDQDGGEVASGTGEPEYSLEMTHDDIDRDLYHRVHIGDIS